MNVLARTGKWLLITAMVLGVAGACVFPLLFEQLSHLYDYWKRSNPANVEQPLTKTTREYLCDMLKLDTDDSRCSSPSFGYEFFPEVRNRYSRHVLYETVDLELGSYLMSCGAWKETESDGTFRTCYYDLTGDGVFPVEILFRHRYVEPTEDLGETWRVCTPAIQTEVSKTIACEP